MTEKGPKLSHMMASPVAELLTAEESKSSPPLAASSSSHDTEDEVMVAPLALSVIQVRYPQLFHQYRSLSDREIESMTNMDQPIDDATIDSATGLRTTINYEDFAASLSTQGDDAGCPMKANSDANKFCIFLWKALCACESGSCGGDACRQYGVLDAAYNDISSFELIAARFEHLLGWTCAVVNHMIHLVMERCDPEQIRSLFMDVAANWKKVFEMIPVEGGMGVSAELRAFAIRTGETLQKLLRAYKKQYKDNFDGVTLSFNFIRKPRAKKAAVATTMTTTTTTTPATAHIGMSATTTTTANAVSATPALLPRVSTSPTSLPPPKDLFAMSNGDGWSITITVVRPSLNVPLGLTVIQHGEYAIQVKAINSSSSLFTDTQLICGMILKTINGTSYTSFEDGVNLLKNAVGQITFVFAFPVTKPAMTTSATAPMMSAATISPAPMMSAATVAAILMSAPNAASSIALVQQMSLNPQFAARILEEARIIATQQNATTITVAAAYDPQGEDEGKRKAPPESTTSNEPVAKMTKTGVANGENVSEEVDGTNANKFNFQ